MDAVDDRREDLKVENKPSTPWERRLQSPLRVSREEELRTWVSVKFRSFSAETKDA